MEQQSGGLFSSAILIDNIATDADPTATAVREFDLIRVIATTDAAHDQKTPQIIEYDT